jgi:rhodanese-related sulfurtransferase
MTRKLVSPAEAFALMREQNYAYLDVRSVTEFELGHPEGAYNIPWQLQPGGAQNPSFLQAAQRAFPSDAKLIVGCRSNRRSAEAATALRAAGFTNLIEQRAGMAGLQDAFGGTLEPGWQASKLPTQTTPLPGHSYQDLGDGSRK